MLWASLGPGDGESPFVVAAVALVAGSVPVRERHIETFRNGGGA